MKTTHRAYAENAGDFIRLSRLMVENNVDIRKYTTWSIGRLVDWKHAIFPLKRSFPSFCDQNAHLWFDAFETLAGFVICENGDAGFTVITRPGFRFLFSEMLQWALANWGQRGKMSIEITGAQDYEAGILVQAGFRQTGTFFTRAFDLTQEPPARFPLEPGFTIVDMATHPDYRAQRVLRANAFSGKNELTEEELREDLKYIHYSHQGPIYHPETDLCVMAPDGCLVSGCEALIDAYNAEADIERVCTHSAYRKRGFARAVIQECMLRLRAIGIRRAYIAGYSQEAIALYGSLGAVDETKAYIYEQG